MLEQKEALAAGHNTCTVHSCFRQPDSTPFLQRTASPHPQTQPTEIPHLLGHWDWFGNRHMSQTWPKGLAMRSLPECLEKRCSGLWSWKNKSLGPLVALLEGSPLRAGGRGGYQHSRKQNWGMRGDPEDIIRGSRSWSSWSQFKLQKLQSCELIILYVFDARWSWVILDWITRQTALV